MEKPDWRVIRFSFFIILLLVIIAPIIISKKIDALKHEKYFETSKIMQSELKTLINENKESVLLIALSMAESDSVKKALLANDNTNLDLNILSTKLARYTTLKNVWFDVITPNGISFYRSWTSAFGDEVIKARPDISKMIQDPKITTFISVGKFDMTFKVMVPIYHQDRFIGIFETISKFDSIAQKMQANKHDMVILVDNSNKKQLIHPYTNTFIGDYYVVNSNAKKELLGFIQSKNIEYFINDNIQPIIDKDTNKLISIYSLPDTNDKPMAYFIMFHDLNDINIDDIMLTRDHSILFLGVLIIIIMVLMYHLYIKQYKVFIDKTNKDLIQKVEEKTKEIADNNATLIYQASALEELNKNLKEKVAHEVEKNLVQDKMMQRQTRLAQMGEMISMIAHQWRQPLSSICAISGTLSIDLMMDNYKKEFFLERLNTIERLSQHLSSTIDDFRNFYKPNKKLVTTTVEKVITTTLSIIQDSLENDNIEILCEYNAKEKMKLYENEMVQVVLNILKNAQDNFKDKKIKNPHIKIKTLAHTISICDNGGGIPSHIMDKIFDPYFSTKDEKNGTGLGLYMSKTIVENHQNGRLSAHNQDKGVCFIIEL